MISNLSCDVGFFKDNHIQQDKAMAKNKQKTPHKYQISKDYSFSFRYSEHSYLFHRIMTI